MKIQHLIKKIALPGICGCILFGSAFVQQSSALQSLEAARDGLSKSDEIVRAIGKEISAGKIAGAKARAEKLRPEAGQNVEYALSLALIEALEHNYEKAIKLLEPFKDSDLIHDQIKRFEKAEKSKSELAGAIGKMLISSSPHAGFSNDAAYFPDSKITLYSADGMLFLRNHKTGTRKKIGQIGAGKTFGYAASLYPEIFACAIKTDGRYIIKVFSETDPAMAAALERAIASQANNITPFIGPDGQTFFFASDRRPSRGGFDIFISTYSDGSWSSPQNAGALINTKGNEIYPWLHADTDTLFFSSNGHEGFGGYDIFSIRLSSGAPPKNIGMPVNDPLDQIGQFSVNLAGNKMYSIREGHMYQAPILYSAEPPAMRFVYGTITTDGKKAEKSIPLKVDTDQGSLGVSESLPDGRFSIALPYFENCIIMPVVKGHLLHTREFESGKGPLIDNVLFDLPKIYPGMKMKYVIHFDTASADIPAREKGKLKELAKILQDNPHIKFEISGHSSGIGTHKAVERVAKLRVASVMDYFLEANINPNRLIVKSYGGEKKIAAADIATAAHLSRRVEINVVSWDDSMSALAGDELKFRIASIQDELSVRRKVNFAIPGYILSGAAILSFGAGGFYTYKSLKAQNDYNNLVDEYRSISYSSWKVQQTEIYQQKLDRIEDDYNRYRKYSMYAYIAGGTLSVGALIFFMSDWFNRITIKELEGEAERLQKVSFDIKCTPHSQEFAFTYRF